MLFLHSPVQVTPPQGVNRATHCGARLQGSADARSRGWLASRVSVVPIESIVSASPFVMYSRLNQARLGGCASADVAPITSQSGNRFAAPMARLPRRFSRDGPCWVVPATPLSLIDHVALRRPSKRNFTSEGSRSWLKSFTFFPGPSSTLGVIEGGLQGRRHRYQELLLLLTQQPCA